MAKTENTVTIAKPNLQQAVFTVYGTAPYVQHKFGQKSKAAMLAAQMSTKGKSRKQKDPRDPEEDYKQAQHFTTDGKHGIPAPAFRSAMISACRVAGFQMTKAKLSVFIVADDLDADDGTPLVYIKGKPEMHEGSVRLESGVASLAFRPMWRKWQADVKIRWDADQFSQDDVANLLERAGQQVGIGEGRPDSKKSHGCGWGTFTLYKD
jgi:hypothetical protein